MSILEQLVLNISGNGRRKDKYEGKDYIVVPAAIMQEGVWNGSLGDVYYPDDEHSKAIQDWNLRPVIINHPELDGKCVSACDPEILERQRVGWTFNSEKDSKLRTEVWLDPDRCAQVEKGMQVLSAINRSETVEVSTGLRFTPDFEPGEYNGVTYNITARQHRPDHLAILPDGPGAYSRVDGGGLGVTNEAGEPIEQFARLFSSASVTVGNQLSFGEIGSELCCLLSKSYGNPGESWNGFIQSVYPKQVVFWDDGQNYIQAYSISKDGEVALEGKAKPADRVQGFQAEDGTYVGNDSSSRPSTVTKTNKGGRAMTKKEKAIEFLATNGYGGDSEKQWLSSLTDTRLELMVKNTKDAVKEEEAAENERKKTELAAENKRKEDEKKAMEAASLVANSGAGSSTVTTAPATKQLTYNELLANADPVTRELMESSRKLFISTKNKLMESIVANSKGQFVLKDLETTPVDQLEKLNNALAPTPEEANQGALANYFGAGINQQAPITTNSEGTGSGKPLGLPSFIGEVMNEAAEKSTRRKKRDLVEV